VKAGTGRDEGFALAAVLVFILLATAIAAPFALAAKSRLMLARNEVVRERMSLLAEGLSHLVVERLPWTLAESRHFGGTASFNCLAGRYRIGVLLQDHGGLIDLNAAEPPLLAIGFRSLGLPESVASTVADSVASSRAPASPFAGGNGLQSQGKQGPLESVTELAQLEALRAIPLARQLAHFTVHSASGTLAIDRAPDSLRRAVRLTTNASVVRARAEIPAWTVVVVVAQDGQAIRGTAGFVVGAPTNEGPARRLEILPMTLSREDTHPASTDCARLFGEAALRQVAGA
jgi:general secretion pathway protein K